ncbi:MAG: sensor domain-containing diguanylate cyclase [Myxococcota bacterium]|nr:sensor domain-containing diguanylate cyclase [Myxococcota bacterium]
MINRDSDLPVNSMHGLLHIVYIGLLGLGGWFLLFMIRDLLPGRFEPWQQGGEFVSVLGLVTCARLLAFRYMGSARIALDSVFYIAMVFIWGTLVAASLAALTLTIDAILRNPVERRSRAVTYYPRLQRVAGILYKGGLPVLVLIFMGALFSDGWMLGSDNVSLIWMLFIFASGFVFVHYVLVGWGHWLEGVETEALGDSIPKLIGQEVFLMPLALAMVLAYRYQGLGFFLLLGGVALMINGVIRRLVIVSEKSIRRASDLQALYEVGRSMSSSLEEDKIVRNLAASVQKLVGSKSYFMLGRLSQGRDTVHCVVFDGRGDVEGEHCLPVGLNLPTRVLESGSPILIDDLRYEYVRFVGGGSYGDGRFLSWLGVPMKLYDEAIGLMAVKGKVMGAFTKADTTVLSAIADQAAVALENARLYEMATVDGLTKLFVRRYFDQRLLEEWQRSLRYEACFSVLLFDLDNFKRMNDQYGHQVGDQVLRMAAGVVRQNMRRMDTAARYGGEEFACILPGTQAGDAFQVGERICAELAATEITTSVGTLNVTASIGIASSDLEEMSEPDKLLTLADVALYEAKNRGKNQARLYSKKLNKFA